MTKILHIIANPKKEEESYSRKLAKKFIEEYTKHHQKDEIETLNLYDVNVPYIDEVDLQATVVKQGKNLTKEEEEKIQLKDKFIAQLKNANKIIVTFPMWNFSIPAILKAYIDHIVVAGKTFQYGSKGPEGLLRNKKICFISASGGDYSKMPEMDMATKYLKTIFGFIGIAEQIEVKISGVAVTQGFEERWKAVKEAKEMAKKF
jgi:FMN-dependent NADH-azoreductase